MSYMSSFPFPGIEKPVCKGTKGRSLRDRAITRLQWMGFMRTFPYALLAASSRTIPKPSKSLTRPTGPWLPSCRSKYWDLVLVFAPPSKKIQTAVSNCGELMRVLRSSLTSRNTRCRCLWSRVQTVAEVCSPVSAPSGRI